MSDATEQPVSALAVLREAIAALAAGDAPRLEQLAARAGKAVAPAGEQRTAREQYAALGLLLALARRNLRLLRGERGRVYGKE
ncbi:MAG: hypothetical protein WA399_20675 [Acidobacteriaceae bacterium]